MGGEAVSCIEFACEGVTGHIHVPDHVVDLTPYGARVWMEFSRFSGPFFYRGRYSEREIDNPSRKTWRAFEKWHREVIGK
jgi:hypothetical protein